VTSASAWRERREVVESKEDSTTAPRSHDVLANCLVSRRLAKSPSMNDIGPRTVDPVDRLADDDIEMAVARLLKEVRPAARYSGGGMSDRGRGVSC